ncbi:MAG: sarcosine oxidase subunit delta [Rhodobacteraceae bacterium CG17_big_fil_post_rev_8_21_14_2_50_65_11]|nr:MAG: sarcosine oxidase subunit delta [Rhodobacteraceae bacterium CG17_big_fil_post_rev_8_21_14_2_50_65_11]
MRIRCPLCGDRDSREFTCMGHETYMHRPAGEGWGPAWDSYLHLRDNPAGVTRDLWYHGAGCTAWLLVERDTTTHDILRVELASDAKRGNA